MGRHKSKLRLKNLERTAEKQRKLEEQQKEHEKLAAEFKPGDIKVLDSKGNIVKIIHNN